LSCNSETQCIDLPNKQKTITVTIAEMRLSLRGLQYMFHSMLQHHTTV